MNYKKIATIVGCIASLTAIASFGIETLKKKDAINKAPHIAEQTTIQATSGNNSPNFSNVNGNVSVTINGGKSKLDIPSYDFSLQPQPGWRRDPKLGEKFNATMASYLDKMVYLSITLPESEGNLAIKKRDEYGRIIFTVSDDIDDQSSGGAEYLIQFAAADANPFEYKNDVTVLAGYFKVYDINGPHQGYMSVNLRPVKMD